MKHRSKKQEALYRKRRPLVQKMLEEIEWCEACPVMAVYEGKVVYNVRRSQDVHELLNRSQGGDILDGRNLIVVCRQCHTWITGHPTESERLGLHLPAWAKDWMYDEAHHVRLSWTQGDKVVPDWLK